MAKNSQKVNSFLGQLIKEYTPKAEEETKAIEEYAQKLEGNDFKLQPYDRFYYSAKMKKELLNITDDEIKPYFNIDSVQINGVFYAAHKVYGLNFKQRKDIPTYHPDLKLQNYSPVIDTVTDDFLAKNLEQRRKAGFITTYYVCCVPHQPNTFMDSPLPEAFWLGFYPAAKGLDGLLRWAYNSWPYDPRHDASYGNWRTG